jgi:transketolase
MDNNLKNKIQLVANKIRKRVLEHTIKNNGGYLSQACSSAEIFSCLYLHIMKLEPVEKPLMPKPFMGTPSNNNKNYVPGYFFNGQHTRTSDRFILSPTHYSLVLYATLIETGRMDENALNDFNKDGSSVEMIGAEHSPGMEVMTGSLGQGLSQAAGIALGRKLKNETGKVWLLMSDGEFQIGMVWEAFQFMNHYKLDNIGIFVDVNKQQCDGAINSVMKIDPLSERLKSFGAEVISIDGHNIEEIINAATIPHTEKPLVVLCNTNPFCGIPELKNNAGKLHYIRFKNEMEKQRYIKELEKLNSILQKE